MMNYILLELPNKKYHTSQNFFVEYHGKSDIDGHFGLLQKVFDQYERKNDILSIYFVTYCFWEYFLGVDTDAKFLIYEDPGREELIQKLQIKDAKQYMSFFSDSGILYGKSVSTFEGSTYRSLRHKVIRSKEERRNKYAPKLKPGEVWAVSPSLIKTMEKRVVLKT